MPKFPEAYFRRPSKIWMFGLGLILTKPCWSITFPHADRSVKAVIIGASISAYPKGSYGDYLQLACRQLDIVNLAKSRLGANQLKQRFHQLVVEPLARSASNSGKPQSGWLIFHGGLNSVSDPYGTNRAIKDTFVLAHEMGWKVLALSLLPWGAERDKRWRGANGLEIQANTQLVVDFVMGRLSPRQAFGDQEPQLDSFRPIELADISVDLYQSALRASDASLRPLGTLTQQISRHPWVQHKLGHKPQQAELEHYTEQARTIPRYFMRKDLQAFDHFHPNGKGHRMMADAICRQLPAEFRCQCDIIATTEVGAIKNLLRQALRGNGSGS